MTSHMPPSTWPATRARSCTARCTTSTAAAGAPPSSSRPRATCSTVTGEGADLLTARADPSPSEDRAKQRVLWPDPSGNGRKMRRNQGPWARAGATGNPCKRPNSAPTAAWIAPRRSGVRVPLAPLGDPPRACGGFFVWGTACSREPDRLGRRLPSECLLGASGEATAHGRGRVSSLDPDDAAADTPRRGPTMRNGNVSPGVSATSGCAATVPRNDGPRHALRADHFVLGRRWPGCGEWSSDEVIL